MIPRVVLDTNVLVSALLKPGGLEDQVFRLGLRGALGLFTSPAVVSEYADVLPRPRLKLDPEEVRTTLEHLRKASMLVSPRQTLTVCRDEADNRFVECADAAAAHFLITGNIRHFPKQWKETRILTAREFLEQFAASAEEKSS